MHIPKSIRDSIRTTLRKYGLDVVRYRLNKLIDYYQIDMVLDVGANIGQFSKELRATGYRGKIVSFEPLSSAYAKLKNTADLDPDWEAVNIGIGNVDGEAEINISGNSYSSSFLAMLPSHEASTPDSGYVGTERILVKRLDSIFDQYCQMGQRIFMKIDTQGFERAVLEGAANALVYIDTVQLEMSLVPLYEGGPLYDEIYELLCDKGYKMVSVEPEFSDVSTGQLLQVNGIFRRPPVD